MYEVERRHGKIRVNEVRSTVQSMMPARVCRTLFGEFVIGYVLQGEHVALRVACILRTSNCSIVGV